MDPDTWPKKVDKTIVTGSNPRGRPRKTWLECKRNDLKVKGFEASVRQNRTTSHWPLNPKSQRDNKVVQPSGKGNNAR